jgi:NAD(P)H-flavin reductase
MRPGDTVEMQAPMGYFVPKQPFRDAVLVATGTGIAPFRSYLAWPAVIEGGRRIDLIFGARYETGLVYREEFEALAGANSMFHFLPTITRPNAGWTGRTGRVQQHLDDVLEGRTEVDVYICGLRAMVDEVRALLKAKGFARQQIVYEKFD